MKKRLKYTLTQLSAFIPAASGLSIGLLYARHFMMLEGKPQEFPFFKIGIFAVIMMASIFSFFKVWAWILVKFKILTKEEAKGYPYSKPWEKKSLN